MRVIASGSSHELIFSRTVRSLFSFIQAWISLHIATPIFLAALKIASFRAGRPVHKAGLADILTAGLGFLFAGIFSIVVLAVFGAFAGISAIWPAANVTKITTNIANSVVAGAAFLTILILLIEVGFVFVVIGLVASVVRM